MKAKTNNKQLNSTHSFFSSSMKEKREKSFFPSSEKFNRGFPDSTFIQPKLKIGQPNDKYEREADSVADQTMRMSPNPNIQPIFYKSAPAMVQRQVPSPDAERGPTVHSPVVDELLVQISDVHGALAGRRLSRLERAVVQPIFGNSIDYARVRLIIGDLAAGTTAGNNIRLPEDFDIANAASKQLLVHEMTHVWQFQHQGAGYITTSLLQQLHAGVTRGNRNFAYEYTINPGDSFFAFEPEQQAFIVENYFAMLRDQQILAQPGGRARTYKSNHLNSAGFNADLTASARSSEIAAELPLHRPLISQMASTSFLSPEVLMNVRQRDVLIMPPNDMFAPTDRDLGFVPTPNLLEIRF